MNDQRSMRLAVAFARDAAHAPRPRLCEICADVVAVTAAGITIMGGDHAGPVCVSSPQVAALEDLQFTIGQGPCRDAFHTGRPVHVARLDATASDRWPPFVERARTSGIGAVFAYPLMSAHATIGVLTLYEQREGELTQDQHDDSACLAQILFETLLSLQEAAPGDSLAAGLDDAVAYRAEIYQASGVIAIQLQIPPAEALARMRAHAFANDRRLADVAADIVGRRLRLGDDRSGLGSDD
ncbi:MAG: GAF and ANTAR domain-containing protein [Actinobacteria bacterium]|nr:GAF and ANTAR domain-containing protein [Actinomycetota bacterium]